MLHLHNSRHLVPAPIGGGHYNAFSLPALIARLQDRYDQWVNSNSEELVNKLFSAAHDHLAPETEDLEGESEELLYNVQYDQEEWVAHIDREGIKLVYADENYDGEQHISWANLQIKKHLLGQVIGDPVVQRLLEK